jgi:hypothetical protein
MPFTLNALDWPTLSHSRVSPSLCCDQKTPKYMSISDRPSQPSSGIIPARSKIGLGCHYCTAGLAAGEPGRVLCEKSC